MYNKNITIGRQVVKNILNNDEQIMYGVIHLKKNTH